MGGDVVTKIRIAVLHFAHETVTFLKNDTTLSDFIYPGSPASGEALLKSYPKSYMGGFVKVAREHEGVELVGIESPLWPKTYMGSGWVTSDAFETLVGRKPNNPVRSAGPTSARSVRRPVRISRRSMRAGTSRPVRMNNS